jgi:predicted helicase
LLQTFSEVYVLNLHGSSKKNEITPEGFPDENVFDIQQGVSISIFIRTPNHKGLGNVFHADLWGSREVKYKFLTESQTKSIKWKKISLEQPNYFFTPINSSNDIEFYSYMPITKIFVESISGVQTKNDELFVDFEKDNLESRLPQFFNNVHKNDFNQKFSTEESWIIKKAQASKFNETYIKPYQLSPFDKRYIYYDEKLLGRSRFKVMKHMLDKNVGLVFMRQSSNYGGYDHFLAVQTLVSDRVFFSAHGTPYLAPLYLYTDKEDEKTSFLFDVEKNERPNISKTFVDQLVKKLDINFLVHGNGDYVTSIGTEDVFNYIYAIIYSPTYRTRYAEFLKIDFPRIPLTSDKALFAALARKGKELVDLHLLKSPQVENFITTYPVSGDNVVEKVRYEDGNVWVNPAQYFGGVPEAVWNFKIGGYQVCDKWLKDRKGRVLSSEDISHYQSVVVALNETIRLMREIDETIPKWPIE